MSLPLRKNIQLEPAKARPFLKWVGGKRQLLFEIEKRLPPTFNEYFEPFLGGGAVYFHFDFHKAIVGDINDDLINAYKVIKKGTEELITILKKHTFSHDEEYFYKTRALETKNLSPLEKAARIIYLNKTCYNGLYRVNSQGKFNVPMGNYKNPLICDEENLRAVHAKLKKTKLIKGDYTKITKNASQGDFVYFDPPYQPISATSSFVNYAKNGFSRDHQVKLSQFFQELTERGVYCMLSNSNAPLIHKLYKGFHISTVKASRPVNSHAARRGKIEELIITNY